MDVFVEYATDPSKELQGVWQPVGTKGGELLIARAGNRKYSRLFSELLEKNQAVLDLKNDASDDKSDEIMIEVAAQTVLLGWKGLKFKGEDLPYSVENARKVLALKDFRALVSTLAGKMESYRVATEAAAVKN